MHGTAKMFTLPPCKNKNGVSEPFPHCYYTRTKCEPKKTDMVFPRCRVPLSRIHVHATITYKTKTGWVISTLPSHKNRNNAESCCPEALYMNSSHSSFLHRLLGCLCQKQAFAPIPLPVLSKPSVCVLYHGHPLRNWQEAELTLNKLKKFVPLYISFRSLCLVQYFISNK